MDQLCFNTSAQVMAYISMGITILNAVLNVVPDPDKIANPYGKLLSRLLHFLAIDIVTAKK